MSPHMKFLKQEEFRILLLNSHQELIRIQTVAIGVLDAAIVEPASVFRPAIAIGAKSIVVVHNHPSGDPTPSEQDIIMTQQLCMCGKLMGIEILDHVIIGLREMNLIPE
ncbi:MAG: JAB domain-containing protein [Theionarchaea archaeon]|nr:JAB domain-containing protein [Theionarchaea archaeon]